METEQFEALMMYVLVGGLKLKQANGTLTAEDLNPVNRQLVN